MWFARLSIGLAWLLAGAAAPAADRLTNDWSVPFNSISDSAPAIGPDGTIYVGTWKGRLWALTPEGARKWTFAAGNENGNLNGNASVFADFDAGDYTPVRAGTLHDAGIYDPSWMDGAADLAGNPRIDHYRRGIGLVDIGAYEAPYIPTATIMFIR